MQDLCDSSITKNNAENNVDKTSSLTQTNTQNPTTSIKSPLTVFPNNLIDAYPNSSFQEVPSQQASTYKTQLKEKILMFNQVTNQKSLKEKLQQFINQDRFCSEGQIQQQKSQYHIQLKEPQDILELEKEPQEHQPIPSADSGVNSSSTNSRIFQQVRQIQDIQASQLGSSSFSRESDSEISRLYGTEPSRIFRTKQLQQENRLNNQEQKLIEQEQKLKELEQTLELKEQKLTYQEQKLKGQEQKLKEHAQHLNSQEQKLYNQSQKIDHVEQQNRLLQSMMQQYKEIMESMQSQIKENEAKSKKRFQSQQEMMIQFQKALAQMQTKTKYREQQDQTRINHLQRRIINREQRIDFLRNLLELKSSQYEQSQGQLTKLYLSFSQKQQEDQEKQSGREENSSQDSFNIQRPYKSQNGQIFPSSGQGALIKKSNAYLGQPGISDIPISQIVPQTAQSQISQNGQQNSLFNQILNADYLPLQVQQINRLHNMRAYLIDKDELEQVSQLISDIRSKDDTTRMESGSQNQLVNHQLLNQTSSGNTNMLKNKQSRKKEQPVDIKYSRWFGLCS